MTGIFSKISEFYEEMWKAIIRPPRDVYSTDQLGPPEFYLQNKRFKRRDFQLHNKRGLKIQCSHFEPVKRDGSYDSVPHPCVIYMHGNCSSRLEAIHCGCLKVLLPLSVSVLCFDFTGSGLSDGDYVSLGWYEREDLEEVVSHLRMRPGVSTIGLWGRSMGAVTACLFADKDPSIAGLVADSPFSSLRRLAEELAADFVGVKLPRFILGLALNMVKNTVMQKANFDLDRLEPIKHCATSFIPALFIAAKDDVFIRSHHARDCHDSYAGEKNFILVDGTHNTQRPDFLHDSIGIFFRFALQLHRVPSGAVHSIPGSIWEDVAVVMAKCEQERRRNMDRKTLNEDRQPALSPRHSNDPLDNRSDSNYVNPPDATETSNQSSASSVIQPDQQEKDSSDDLQSCASESISRSGSKGRTQTKRQTSNQEHPDVETVHEDFEFINGLENNASQQLPNFPFASLENEFDVEQQYEIWKTIKKSKRNQERNCGSRDDQNDSEGSLACQAILNSFDYIPEANIEELLEEVTSDEELMEKLKRYGEEADLNLFSSSSSSLDQQAAVTAPSDPCLMGLSPTSVLQKRFNMTAPHRTTETVEESPIHEEASATAPISQTPDPSSDNRNPSSRLRSFKFWSK